MRCAFGVLALVLLFTGSSWAQTSTGEVVGTVSDSSGGVMPGVAVTLTNARTNEARDAVTDDGGHYRFVYVLPGTYSVHAELAGFRGVTVKDLAVTVDAPRRQDIVLEPGASETVNVTAHAVAVNAETPTLGTVIEARQIAELPLNGRGFIGLAYLSAGTVQPGVGNVGSTATSLSGGRANVAVVVSGMREGSNEILVDGILSKHNYYGAAAVQPVLDGIAEFKVQQGYFSPEYGLPAVTNVITKSGGNTLRGAAWEFLRHDALNARPPFARTKGKTRQHQFGASGGGAVVRDRLFWFGAYEGQRIRTPSGSTRTTVPTPAMLNGDFSALLPQKPIYDPLTYDPVTRTRQPFPGNIIPADRISPFAKAFNPFIPPPEGGDDVVNRIVNAELNQRDYKFDVRVDYAASSSSRFFSRVSMSDSQQELTHVLPSNTQGSPFVAANAVAGWTKILSSRLTSDLRIGLDRARLSSNLPHNGASHPNWPEQLGLRNLNQTPACNALPRVNLAGYANYGFLFENCVSTQNSNFTLLENMAYARGRHHLTFGGQVTRVNMREIIGARPNGVFTYTGQFSGDSAADYLLGAVQTASGQPTSSPAYRYGTWWNVYVNDNFRVAKDLTLNLGVRYQYTQPLLEEQDRLTMIDLKTGEVLLAGKNGVSRGLLTPDRNDFAPRVGFAWAPGGSDRWALRGSYGLFYDRLPGNQWGWQMGNPPYTLGQTLISDANVPTVSMTGLFPDIDPYNPALFKGVTLANLADRRSPYIQQWTLSAQRTLPWSMLVEAAYVGSAGSNLSQRVDANVAPLPAPDDTRPLSQRRPLPQYSEILQDQGTMSSNYDALQVSVRKALSRGLSFNASHTWAKSMDGGDWGDIGTNYGGILHRGRSKWDIRHRFTGSVIYELPFFEGSKGLLRQAVHGWQVNVIMTLQTGAPFHVSTTADPSDTGIVFFKMPTRSCDGNLPAGERTTMRWFDTSCFSLPAPRTYGNAGVGYLDGPSYKNVDLSMNKRFDLGSGRSLQVRAEAFNLFNHTNYSLPNANVQSASFGRITGAGGPPRIIQLGVKLLY